MQLIAIYTTTSTREEAQHIARTLLERQLVACIQIEHIESFYIWNGAIQHEPEYRLMLKTTADQYTAVESAIRELHSYELPAIHALPVMQAYAPYADWVIASTHP